MKLEDIQELWNKDSEIDYTELGTESIRIPLIHDKYLKIFTDERIRLKGVEFELSKMVRIKTEYYSGKMSQEELDRRGWDQYLGRLLKNEITNYIESDDDVIKLKKDFHKDKRIKKCDWIIHLAGINKSNGQNNVYVDNIDLTNKLVESVSKDTNIIFASSTLIQEIIKLNLIQIFIRKN